MSSTPESTEMRQRTPNAQLSHLKEGLKKTGKHLKKGGSKSIQAVNSVWNDFKEFINRGSVVDLAVGIVMGAAFTAIVNSLVNDIVMPLISLANPNGNSFSNMYVILDDCKHLLPNATSNGQTPACSPSSWKTVAEANKAGVITWNYGNFLQVLINFIIISIIVFFIVKLYSATFLRKKKEEEEEEEEEEVKDGSVAIPVKH